MLYYSGDFTSPAYTSEIKGVIDGLLSDASAAPWAPCFSLGGVQLLDARLPPEVDSYTPENQSSSNVCFYFMYLMFVSLFMPMFRLR